MISLMLEFNLIDILNNLIQSFIMIALAFLINYLIIFLMIEINLNYNLNDVLHVIIFFLSTRPQIYMSAQLDTIREYPLQNKTI